MAVGEQRVGVDRAQLGGLQRVEQGVDHVVERPLRPAGGSASSSACGGREVGAS